MKYVVFYLVGLLTALIHGNSQTLASTPSGGDSLDAFKTIDDRRRRPEATLRPIPPLDSNPSEINPSGYAHPVHARDRAEVLLWSLRASNRFELRR